MASEYEGRINKESLALQHARLGPSSLASLSSDGQIELWWDVGASLAGEASAFVRSEYRTLSDFDVQLTHFSGTYRSVGVEVDYGRNSDRAPAIVKLTVRKGFAVAFAWSEVLVGKVHTSPSNTSKITDPDTAEDVDNSTSDSPVEALTLRMPNCDTAYAQAIGKSIAAALTALGAKKLTIEGQKHGAASGWHFLVADAERADDGSSTVVFVLAKPQFTINAFRSNNTAQESNIGYLFSVPEALAQSIISAWDAGQGRSATCSRDASGGLLDIVLTSFAGKANMTTPWVPTTCDTYRRHHFAWGYTEDEVYVADPESGFIANHDSAIGTTEDDKVIRSRQLNIQTRGDGLFDVVITETSWASHTDAEGTPDYTITLVTGTKITRQTLYGYNWSLTDITPDAFKDQFDVTAAAVGVTTNLQITRQDDCSFDWVGEITTATEIDSGQQTKQPAAAEGVGNVVQAIAHATAAEVGTALQAFTPAIGKSLQVELSVNDDETFGAVFREVTAQTPEGTGTHAKGATHGTGLALATGRNATLTEVTTAIATFTSGARKSLDVNMGANDDGGWNYSITEREVRAVSGSKVIGDHTLYYGLNQDAHLATDLSGVVVRSSSIVANADGTKNYSILVKPLDTAAPTDADATSKNKRYYYVGINRDALPTPSEARINSYSARFGENGKYDYSISAQDYEEVTDSRSDSGSGITRDVSVGIHSTALPTPASSRLITDSISPGADEEGGFSWSRVIETKVETDLIGDHALLADTTNTGIRHGSQGEKIASRISRNDDPTTLDTDDYVTGAGKKVVLQASVDDAGNLSYRKDTIQKAEQNATLQGGDFTQIESIKKAVGDVGLDELDASATVVEGVSVSWRARFDADGSIDWDRITRTAVEKWAGDKSDGDDPAIIINLARLEPSLDRYGYSDEAIVFRNVSVANIVNYDIVIATEYGYIQSLEMNVDGTLNGVKIVRTYNGTVGVAWSNNASPEDVTDEDPSNTAPNSWTKTWLIWDEAFTQYKEAQIVYEEKWSSDYGEIINFLISGTAGFSNGPSYRPISGRTYWWAQKATSVTIPYTWTTNTGAGIVPK